MFVSDSGLAGDAGSVSRIEGSGPVRAAVRAALLMAAASLALPMAASADEGEVEEDIALEEVVVSGTRVVRDGYEAPTPVSVVTMEEIQNFASTNVADALNTLPAIAGSWSPQANQVNASSGNAGINALNLRNIGTNRTLIMVNGQRVVASSSTGLVDINTLPQELVKRVEVVTGGASASWGSDAVGGVVNFILDTNYTGLKASLQAGATTYGDNRNARFTLTSGTPFADGRGHLLFSGFVDGSQPIIHNKRDWNLAGWQTVLNPAYNATTNSSVPQRILLDKVSAYQGVIGGVITSGPLAGTAFGNGGLPYHIAPGQLVQNDRYNVGGPMWEQLAIRGKHGSEPLASRMRTMGAYLQTSYDLTDDIEVSLALNRSRSQTRNWAFSLEDYGGITIKSGNPFIPASVQEAMTAQNITTLALGSMHPDLDIAKATGDRTVTRVALSLDGKFGEGWHWNAYYQYGESKQAYATPGMWNNANLAKAYDAVVNPVNGAIVCRVQLTDPNDPCVPYNPFGIGVNSPAAVNYVEGNGLIQQRMNYMSQNVVAASIDGTPFSLWAGEVSVAAGAEWRREWMGRSWVDASSLANEWWAGNSRPSRGVFNVKEAFVETVVPLAVDQAFAKSLDLQAAVRVEDYSTAGTVTAWKVGTTWKPVESVTVRGSLSHDVRAPNLNELYSAGAGSAPYIEDPWQSGLEYGISVLNVGNRDLRPEGADSWSAGVVFQPTFLPGFGASVDYWDTDIDNAIGTALGQQDIVNRCFEGETAFCSLISYSNGPGSDITVVRRSPVNNANARYRGVDYEMSYRFSPSFVPGTISLRAMATNYLENSSVTDGVKTETVGQNTGSVPDWRFTASASWSNADWSGSLTARGVSSGVYNNYYIECSNNCPVSNTRNVTVSENDIKGAVYFDASVSKTLRFGDEGSSANVFLNVRNLLNKDPAVVGQYGSYADTLSPANPRLYDVLGRVFSLGVRVEF